MLPGGYNALHTAWRSALSSISRLPAAARACAVLDTMGKPEPSLSLNLPKPSPPCCALNHALHLQTKAGPEASGSSGSSGSRLHRLKLSDTFREFGK